MTNIDDLGIASISNMSTDEALELIRQIRLSRRIPVKKPTKKTTTTTQKRVKALPQVSADQANELLKILTGGN